MPASAFSSCRGPGCTMRRPTATVCPRASTTAPETCSRSCAGTGPGITGLASCRTSSCAGWASLPCSRACGAGPSSSGPLPAEWSTLREAGSGSGARGEERPRRGPRLPSESFFAPIATSPAARGPRTALVTATSPAARLRWVFAYRTLLKYLVLREIKTKSRGTYLGVGWTLMNPLFTIVVYFVIFRHIFRVAIPDFLGFFLLGFLMWTFFSRSISSAATCIVENESMVKRALFPLEILPLTKVLYHLFNHLIAVGIALPLLIVLWGGKISWHLFWICLLYTSDAADERSSVDLGGRRII